MMRQKITQEKWLLIWRIARSKSKFEAEGFLTELCDEVVKSTLTNVADELAKHRDNAPLGSHGDQHNNTLDWCVAFIRAQTEERVVI